MANTNLKNIVVLLIAGIELLAGYASVGKAQGTRCEREDFPMIPIQSWARSVWTGRCAEPQLRYMWEVKMGNPKNMPYEKIEKETVEKWVYVSKDVYRDRPFFPTFGKEGSDEVFRAPVQLFTGCIPDPTGYEIMGLCRSNPEKINVSIAMADGEKSVSEIVGDASSKILVLANDLGSGELAFESTKAIAVKAARQNATIEVLEFDLSSGRSMRVNRSHRFVTAAGSAIRASDLRKSDAILDSHGQPDTVIGIETATYYGPTYVLSSKKGIHKKAITVTEGFLDATNWHQLDDLDLVDKRMARHSIPDHLVAD